MADNSKITLNQLKTAMIQTKNYTDEKYNTLNQQIAEILERLGILENYHKVKVYNIPRLNLTGDISAMSADVASELQCELLDVYDTPIFEGKRCKVTWQGNSSLNWPKKNFSIKLYESDGITKYKHEFFSDIGAYNSYHLKADYEDATRSRNIVSATIAESMYSKKLPTGGRSTMEGFAVQIYINDTYQGLYSWNTKQCDKVYKLDETNENHLMYRANGSNYATNMFRALSVDNREDIGDDWEDRFPGTNTAENRAKLNRLIQWVMDCENDINKFTSELEQYFDKEYLLKYTILAYVGGMWDNIANNFNLVTYDGLVWYPTFYDLDSTWGYHYASSPISTSYAFPSDYAGGNSLLFNLVMEAYKDTDLKAIYKELRAGALSYNNIVAAFDNKLAEITQDELDKDLSKWGRGGYDLAATKEWIQGRLSYVDSDIINETIAVEGITLSDHTLSLTVGNQSTLTYAINPDTANNKTVTWSTNNANCTVVDGLVTAVSEGSCVITVTANDTTNGTISDTCTVTVSAAVAPADGLLCELQASNHGSSTITWTDVSGNGNDATLVGFNDNGSEGFVDNQLVIVHGRAHYVRLNDAFKTLRDYTIELNGIFTSNSSSTIVAHRTNWNNNMLYQIYFNNATGNMIMECQKSYNIYSSYDSSSVHTIKVRIDVDNSTVIVKIDDTVVFNRTDIEFTFPNATPNLAVGSCVDAPNESCSCNINYIKVYSGDALD